jgi:hypothetical protein
VADEFQKQWRCLRGGRFDEKAGLVHMRDSKDRPGPVLTFDYTAFREFIDFVTETSTTER